MDIKYCFSDQGSFYKSGPEVLWDTTALRSLTHLRRRHFTEDILEEISSMKSYVFYSNFTEVFSKGPINNNPALV